MKLELDFVVRGKYRAPDVFGSGPNQGLIQVEMEYADSATLLVKVHDVDASYYKIGKSYTVHVSDEYVNCSEFYVDQLCLTSDDVVLVSVKGNTQDIYIEGLSFVLTVEEAANLDVGTEVSVLIEKK